MDFINILKISDTFLKMFRKIQNLFLIHIIIIFKFIADQAKNLLHFYIFFGSLSSRRLVPVVGPTEQCGCLHDILTLSILIQQPFTWLSRRGFKLGTLEHYLVFDWCARPLSHHSGFILTFKKLTVFASNDKIIVPTNLQYL